MKQPSSCVKTRPNMSLRVTTCRYSVLPHIALVTSSDKVSTGGGALLVQVNAVESQLEAG